MLFGWTANIRKSFPYFSFEDKAGEVSNVIQYSLKYSLRWTTKSRLRDANSKGILFTSKSREINQRLPNLPKILNFRMIHNSLENNNIRRKNYWQDKTSITLKERVYVEFF